MLTRALFLVAFTTSLDAIRQAEDVTRRELKGLCNSLLSALHGIGSDPLLIGDIQFTNQLLPALTPINRKVAVLFFKHFAGFHYDEKLMVFTKKSTKRYMDAKNDALAFLQDPNNNIFSWANRHIDIEVKPFNDATLTKYIEGQIKKAAADGKTQKDVLKAVLAAGITAEIVLQVMGELAKQADAAAPVGALVSPPAIDAPF